MFSDITFLRLELDDYSNRPEDLFLSDLHRGRNVGKDRWLDEESLVAVLQTTGLDCRPIRLPRIDVSENALEIDSQVGQSITPLTRGNHTNVKLGPRDLGSLVCFWIERVSKLLGLGKRLEALQKFVVDSFLNVDS